MNYWKTNQVSSFFGQLGTTDAKRQTQMTSMEKTGWHCDFGGAAQGRIITCWLAGIIYYELKFKRMPRQICIYLPDCFLTFIYSMYSY